MKRDANDEIVRDANGNPVYENQYHITDHLGSVRVIFNQDGELLARNDYYPFGKQHDNPSLTANLPNPAGPNANRFLFNGKENQMFGGLGLLDYGWRMYDSEKGRWDGMDILSESNYPQSPFAFTSNNPVNKLDLDGNSDDWVRNLQNGSYTWMDNK